MDIVSFFFVFAIVWWVVIFVTLPFGVEISENPEQGHADSAPKKTHLGIKMIATTVISLILTYFIMYAWESGWIV